MTAFTLQNLDMALIQNVARLRALRCTERSAASLWSPFEHLLAGPAAPDLSNKFVGDVVSP